jgi:hypothetical protein
MRFSLIDCFGFVFFFLLERRVIESIFSVGWVDESRRRDLLICLCCEYCDMLLVVRS